MNTNGQISRYFKCLAGSYGLFHKIANHIGLRAWIVTTFSNYYLPFGPADRWKLRAELPTTRRLRFLEPCPCVLCFTKSVNRAAESKVVIRPDERFGLLMSDPTYQPFPSTIYTWCGGVHPPRFGLLSAISRLVSRWSAYNVGVRHPVVVTLVNIRCSLRH